MLDTVDVPAGAPPAALTDDEMRRYMRQIVVQPFGMSGQTALRTGHVLVVGAGGLGSPVIAYLAAAGVGTIGIADDDTVSISNLNRQVLYRSDDVGKGKAERAATFARALNDTITVKAVATRLDGPGVLAVVRDYDLVIDGSDNLETRRAIATACFREGLPLVCGAVGQIEGHVAVLPRGSADPAFEWMFPSARNDAEPSCEANGIIGAVAGVVGSLMAMEAIKVLTGMGTPIAGRLLHYDGLAGTFSETQVGQRRPRLLVGG